MLEKDSPESFSSGMMGRVAQKKENRKKETEGLSACSHSKRERDMHRKKQKMRRDEKKGETHRRRQRGTARENLKESKTLVT